MRKKQILEQLAALKDQLKTDERRLQLAAAEGQEVKPEEVTALHTTEDKITALEAELKGIEDRCWVQVADFGRVYAIADEDLERENAEKTSSVHFLRFELTDAMVAALRGGARLAVGIDHPAYAHSVDSVTDAVRASLLADLA